MPLDEDEKVTLRRLIKAQKAKGDKPLLLSDEQNPEKVLIYAYMAGHGCAGLF